MCGRVAMLSLVLAACSGGNDNRQVTSGFASVSFDRTDDRGDRGHERRDDGRRQWIRLRRHRARDVRRHVEWLAVQFAGMNDGLVTFGAEESSP